MVAGMVVERAVELVEKGVPFDQLEARLDEVARQSHVFFAVKSLDYLYKGGRINGHIYRIGSVLNIKPVLTCDEDGYYAIAKKARGWDRALDTMVSLACEKARAYKRARLAVCCSTATSALYKPLEDRLRDALDNIESIQRHDLSADLLVHTDRTWRAWACRTRSWPSKQTRRTPPHGHGATRRREAVWRRTCRATFAKTSARWEGSVRPRLRGLQRRQHLRPHRRGRADHHPSGVSKGRMDPGMLVRCDLQGNVVAGDASGRFPSSEVKMHLAVYRNRPDVRAVVHAHPVYATAFAICRHALEEPYLPELILNFGKIPVADFAMLSTDEVPNSILPYVHDYNGLLLANHGAVAWERTSGRPSTSWRPSSTAPRSSRRCTTWAVAWSSRPARWTTCVACTSSIASAPRTATTTRRTAQTTARARANRRRTWQLTWKTAP